MADQIGGKVLGPRPGKAACSFTQGIMEMVLRLGAAIIGIFPIIIGALVLGYSLQYRPVMNEEGFNDMQIMDMNDNDDMNFSMSNASSLTSSQMGAVAVGVLDIIFGALIMLWAVVMIIIRILNIGAVNLGSKYFLAIDIVISCVFTAAMLIIAIVSAVFAAIWDSLNGQFADGTFASLIVGTVS
jgi:hypothetical protein